MLGEVRVPGGVDEALGVPPRLTVTEMVGGESYSIIPDRCSVRVDARLTTDFDEQAAKILVHDTVAALDDRWPRTDPPTTVQFLESWPAYVLGQDTSVRVALTEAARRCTGAAIATSVAGPSNIGNYLAKLGVDATAGLGVNYRGLHGTDERIELATVPLVQSIYQEAAYGLLEPGVDR